MLSLKLTLMRRDKISAEEAQELIDDAREELHELLAQNLFDEAENICETHFGLEPDFLIELM